ncbi:hypothetical protein BGW41_000913 [Actinomortierella wolfii]|nr:hypothetical protein BGW41_000913 [Actinomortierella wolfii]
MVECPLCLQKRLQESPGCAGTNITLQAIDVVSNPGIAKCLCANVDGSFMDPCAGETVCGSELDLFKNSFKSNLEQAGLRCNGTTPTFIPPPADPIAPSNTGSTSPTPTGKDGPGSASTRLMAPVAASLVALVATIAFQFL